jgi:hypothetical protein
MTKHFGLLGFLSEAVEIREELGVSVDEAFRIQRERAAERQESKSNVIPFRRKH